jgi:DNA polymerase III subunit delta'
VPTVPLYGHAALRERMQTARAAGSIPSSFLLHGPAGIGKQRLALWIGQLILCEGNASTGARPCGSCDQCRYSMAYVHPDLHWIFPTTRSKDPNPSPADVRLEFADAVAERVTDGMLYPPSSGTEGIFVATVRAVVHDAALAPTLARRKVFVIGGADRMVSQEGSDQAANAFLKLLEEPPSNTTVILTSSEPGALLPTIRSRVVSYRVSGVAEGDMTAFLRDPVVANRYSAQLRALESDRGAMRTFIRAGAPGRLLAGESVQRAFETARTFLAASMSGQRTQAIAAVYSLGAAGARGAFSDFLDALVELVHNRIRATLQNGDDRAVPQAAAAIFEIDNARQLASGNVSPQLLGMRLAVALARIPR